MATTNEVINLWSSMLRETSKKCKQIDATCCLLTDFAATNHKISQSLCPDCDFLVSKDTIDFVDSFQFVEGEENIDTDDQTRINVWSLNSTYFHDATDFFLSNEMKQRFCFVIGVNTLASFQEGIDTIRKSLTLIRYFSERWKDKLGEVEFEVEKENFLSRIAHDRNVSSVPLGNTEWRQEIKYNFGFSVVIVLLSLQGQEIAPESLRQLRELQSFARKCCVQVGGSVIDLVPTDNESVLRLRRVISHYLYPDNSMLPHLQLEIKLGGCFVPSGFDSLELITVGTLLPDNISPFDIVGSEASSRIQLPLESHSTEAPRIEIENEDEWLTGLQQFIQQVSENSSGTASSATKDSIISTQLGHEEKQPSRAPQSKPRRVSVAAAAQGEQEVNSFFQNLLSSTSTGAKSVK